MPYLFLLLLIAYSHLEATLTLEEKVGQLLVVHFHGEEANDEARLLLEKAHVGGVIYYNWANVLSSPAQVQKLSLSLQDMNRKCGSETPLFLCVDQEGGRVNRLQSGFTLFPSQRQIALTGLPELECQVAEAIGKELKLVGINFNFAPVVDIVNNAGVIGDRSFGNSPSEVTRFTEASLQGYREAGVISALKHFPGYGDAAIDPHSDTPTINKSLQSLQESDLYPYRMLANQVDAIMTGHLLAPALDAKLPATISGAILTDLLRQDMHFEGVIISDSLVMKGLTKLTHSYEEAALQAFNAGCDLLCLGGALLNEPTQDELTGEDVLRIHEYLVQAVLSGRISEKRLDESVDRIVRLKTRYGLDQWEKLQLLDKNESVSNLTHQHLKDTVILLAEMQAILTPEIIACIGQKIWENECNGRTDQLITWNSGEGFASVGMGHFIWYPEGAKETFVAGFPQYLSYLRNQGIPIPPGINEKVPWNSREDFLSSEKENLSQWLTQTLDHQASFIIHRSMESLYRIINESPAHVLDPICQLMQTPQGLFALIDYLNFKGEGLSPTKRYQGQGWGLYQVLIRMNSLRGAPLERFQSAARQIISERVMLAAPLRDESRWLPGWLNRINRYAKF